MLIKLFRCPTSCCYISQREQHLDIYHCRNIGNSKMGQPHPMVSCHEPLQHTRMLFVERRREVIQCNSSGQGAWFPASAPYVIQAWDIKEICWAQRSPCQELDANAPSVATFSTALGLELSFRWYWLCHNPSFRLEARSGYNPLLC